jgi:hypothetical protein
VIAVSDGQQTWPGQSLPVVQLFSQLVAQRPLQQIDPDDPVQSELTEQVCGQFAAATHTPLTARPGSAFAAAVQHTWPEVVQSAFDVHDVGHSFAAVQIGFV